MILVDTTVWIDHFAGKQTPGTGKLRRAIDGGEDLAVCGLVMTEVLQGIRHDREFAKTEMVLRNLLYLPASLQCHVRAAGIFRGCRGKGVTIRKTNDCVIAAVCIDNTAFLLHNDRDFDAIARHFPLQCY